MDDVQLPVTQGNNDKPCSDFASITLFQHTAPFLITLWLLMAKTMLLRCAKSRSHHSVVCHHSALCMAHQPLLTYTLLSGRRYRLGPAITVPVH